MSWTFERVAGPFSFAEGPVWDGEAVLFTDIPTSRIMRYHPKSGTCEPYLTRTAGANGLRMDATGRIYTCEHAGRRIRRFNPDGTSIVLVETFDGRQLNSPNDLDIDSQGRIWFSDPYYGGPAYVDHTGSLELEHQSVYRLDPHPNDTWHISRVTFDTTKPNGLLISPDEHTLYVAQSDKAPEHPRELRAYPILPDGSLGEYTCLYDFGAHRGIDGMTLDDRGNIIATAGWRESGPGPMVYVFSPEGRVLGEHPFPEDTPTNCTFGDADLRSLYVTCGGDGSMYRARTDLKGFIRDGVR